MKFPSNCLYLLTVFGLAACGQRGPLYLPDNPPPGIKGVADDSQLAPIPERDLDEAPPRPAESKAKEDPSPTEKMQ